MTQGFVAQRDTRTPPYTCDHQALGVTSTSIEAARNEALARFDPPYDWRTWLAHMNNLKAEQNYTEACSHLAAFIEIYKDTVPLDQLPMRMPPVELE